MIDDTKCRPVVPRVGGGSFCEVLRTLRFGIVDVNVRSLGAPDSDGSGLGSERERSRVMGGIAVMLRAEISTRMATRSFPIAIVHRQMLNEQLGDEINVASTKMGLYLHLCRRTESLWKCTPLAKRLRRPFRFLTT